MKKYPKYVKYKQDSKTYFGKILGIRSSDDAPNDIMFEIEFTERLYFSHINTRKTSYLYRWRCQEITEEEYNIALVLDS